VRRRGTTCALWTVASAGKTFRVKTCSAKDAISFAEQRTNMPAVLLDLEFQPEARQRQESDVRRTTGLGRHERRRGVLLPEAIRRRAAGETVTQIAKGLHVARETLRDWLLIAGA
jgi:hypothetical protein